ncbi:uncharacterized protein [Clytia hemisphaerica]|uniref:uncharacterized protein isoform X1 n=1 Tax=Clytia hemisphaerica TaxID=252671 RepID=UPI0034D4CB9F
MDRNSGLDDLVNVSIDMLYSEQEAQVAAQAIAPENEASNKTKSGKKMIGCPICGIEYATLYNLKRHMATKHKDVPIPDTLSRGNTKCLECNARFYQTKELVKHLESEHKMEFQIETLTFRDLEEFDAWKDNYEKTNHCYYIAYGSRWDDDPGKNFKDFRCNRSGWYRSKKSNDEPRQRKMKSAGSNKIGNNCTSTIKLRDKVDGTLQATINMTHYSHEIEIKHVSRKVRDYNIEQGTTDYIYPDTKSVKRAYKRRVDFCFSVTPAQREELSNVKYQIQAELLKIQELVEGSSVSNLQNIQMLYNRLQTARTVYEETNVP